MIDHYTNKIQNVIQMELFKAQKSIKIAMAWFTNDLLFQPLLMKLQVGVTVEIILNKDEINDSKDNPVDFNEFINLGGILRWNDTKQLLHEKFCVIDDKVVLSGSYNWTNKAEINDEILTVFREESKTTEFFNKKFGILSKKYSQSIAVPRNNHDVKEFNVVSRPLTANYNYWSETHEYSFLSSLYSECIKEIPFEDLNIIKECPELLFYDDYKFILGKRRKKGKNSLTVIDSLIAKKNGKIAILDTTTLLPATPFVFDYYIIKDTVIWFGVCSKGLGTMHHIYKSDTKTITIQGIRLHETSDDLRERDYCISDKEHNLGLVDKNGGVILDFKYNKGTCLYCDDGLCYAFELNNTWDFVDIKNNKIYHNDDSKIMLWDFIENKYSKIDYKYGVEY